MSILWKMEQDFKYALEEALQSAIYNDLTIKELLEIGFNNNWLILGDKKIELGWASDDGKLNTSLNEEQLKVHVYMDEDCLYDSDIDGDGYHIAKVYLDNEEDERLFVASDEK